jgi:hypothetical protein
VSPPVDPRANRFDRLSTLLRISVVTTAALACGALFTRGGPAATLGGAMVAVLVGTPLVRVAWFVQRWFRRGDPRYALVGMTVLTVVGVGALIA